MAPRAPSMYFMKEDGRWFGIDTCILQLNSNREARCLRDQVADALRRGLIAGDVDLFCAHAFDHALSLAGIRRIHPRGEWAYRGSDSARKQRLKSRGR